MDCPECKTAVGGIVLRIGVVKVAVFSCPCGRHWRLSQLAGSLNVNDLVSALEDLHSRFPGDKSDNVKQAIHFLQAQIDAKNYSHFAAGKPKSTREKAADLWERRFINAAVGD